MVGERIGQYELLEIIGEGAESRIYRARDTITGRCVAIKDVIVTEREKNKYLRHVRNEYQILRKLWSEPRPTNGAAGLVGVYELMTSGWLRRSKRCSLVMEFIEGKDLRREKRYPLGQMTDFFRKAAEALALIHAKGIVHVDVKPENIIVGPQGKVTLVDFGLSCRSGSRAERIRGSREYIAPEQLNCGIITPMTDVFNFGATMYYLLTDTHVPALMPSAHENGIFIGSENARPRDLREYNPHIPERLSRLVLACCERDISRRFASAERIAQSLREISKEFIALS